MSDIRSEMNLSLIDNPDDPTRSVLDGIDLDQITRTATAAASYLSVRGYVHFVLEPGDATRYEIGICRRMVDGGPPYWFSSSLGPSYGWNAAGTLHPDFIAGLQVVHGHVYALLLNEIAVRL